jgi:hypothetical protein
VVTRFLQPVPELARAPRCFARRSCPIAQAVLATRLWRRRDRSISMRLESQTEAEGRVSVRPGHHRRGLEARGRADCRLTAGPTSGECVARIRRDPPALPAPQRGEGADTPYRRLRRTTWPRLGARAHRRRSAHAARAQGKRLLAQLRSGDRLTPPGHAGCGVCVHLVERLLLEQHLRKRIEPFALRAQQG